MWLDPNTEEYGTLPCQGHTNKKKSPRRDSVLKNRSLLARRQQSRRPLARAASSSFRPESCQSLIQTPPEVPGPTSSRTPPPRFPFCRKPPDRCSYSGNVPAHPSQASRHHKCRQKTPQSLAATLGVGTTADKRDRPGKAILKPGPRSMHTRTRKAQHLNPWMPGFAPYPQ